MLTMGKEMHRLEGIVEQMLFMAKLQDETEFGTWVRLDLQNIINEIVDEYREIAIGRRLTLCYYPIDNMPALFGSGEMIRQMIRVLVDNAIKYSPAGNRVDIRPLHRSENGLLQIGFRITNTGVRIPQHERAQIFERFYRGQSSIDRQVPGAGLGLATAREIAHMHQGSIHLEDVTSEQVAITILLPGIALTESRHSA
jgi:signal transduction histidine kinase